MCLEYLKVESKWKNEEKNNSKHKYIEILLASPYVTILTTQKNYSMSNVLTKLRKKVMKSVPKTNTKCGQRCSSIFHAN